MSVRYVAIVLVLAVAFVLLAGSAFPASRQVDRHVYAFHGTVTMTAPSHHRLQIRTSTNGLMRFHTGRATRWDGCDWNEMSHGHAVTIHGYRSHGFWMATRISDRHHRDQHHAMMN